MSFMHGCHKHRRFRYIFFGELSSKLHNVVQIIRECNVSINWINFPQNFCGVFPQGSVSLKFSKKLLQFSQNFMKVPLNFHIICSIFAKSPNGEYVMSTLKKWKKSAYVPAAEVKLLWTPLCMRMSKYIWTSW